VVGVDDGFDTRLGIAHAGQCEPVSKTARDSRQRKERSEDQGDAPHPAALSSGLVHANRSHRGSLLAGRTGLACAPCKCTQPGDELLEGKGLDEVAVGAEVEAGDLVLQQARRGEHEDAGLAPGGSEPSADLVAVNVRQVAVQRDQVAGRDERLLEPRSTVAGQVNGHPLATQAASDDLGQGVLIFDDQYTHLGLYFTAHGSIVIFAYRS